MNRRKFLKALGLIAGSAVVAPKVALALIESKPKWTLKNFDYVNKTGYATGVIYGGQKIRFNSKDYAIVSYRSKRA